MTSDNSIPTNNNASTASHDGYLVLDYTQPNREGGSGNNIELVRKILREISTWAGQFDHGDAVTLKKALGDLDKLMVTCWTEVDESLVRLTLADQRIRKGGNTDDGLMYIEHAKQMLNRWQGRDGRVGNVDI